MFAYAPGDEFPKSVNLEEPSVTLVPADVLATAISKTILLLVMMIYVR
jgi:DNA polymerase-3 subunit beta